ncbi:MAG: tetratricopeptide repeat protein [Bacteroidota bacterium]
MAGNPGGVSRFWQELKARNVLRVTTLYVAIAFGLMELIDIVSGPLNLPAWVLSVVILLSAVGLPVTIILSWVFLLTPEGIQRYRHVASQILAETKEEHPSMEGGTFADYSFADGMIVYESDLPEFSTLGKSGRRMGKIYGLSSFTIISLVVLFFLFYSGKSAPFQERDWVVLADFINHTEQEVFDHSLNTAFEISIDQSRHINVVSGRRVQEALKRIGKDAGAVIDEEICREIAIREGAKVYIVPEISRVGDQYILTGKLQESESGRVVASEMVYSEDQDGIIEQLDRISRRMRRHLGESRYSISGQSKPLAQVTTSSLDALKQFSLAIESHVFMDFEKAITHYRLAIGLDSTFTAAKASLGNILYERYDQEEGKMWLDEAILSLDDLTEREINGILAFYAASIEHDLDKAISYTELNIELYPDNIASRNNLGWYMQNQGRYREAAEHYRKAIAIDPYSMLPYGGLIWIFNEFTGEADSVITRARQMISYGPDNGWAYFYLGSGYFPKDELILAEEAFEKCFELIPGLALNGFRLANTRRVLGKYEEAVEVLKDLLQVNPRASNAYYQMGFFYELMGKEEEAKSNYRRFLDITDFWMQEFSDDPVSFYAHAKVLTRLGELEQSMHTGEKAFKMDTARHMEYAQFLAVRQDIEGALDQVKKGLEDGYRDYCWIKMNPDLANLQEEERFKALLDQYFD